MFSVQVEMVGSVQNTPKGFLAQYLLSGADGKKHVIKAFSKDANKLPAAGKINLQNDFFFVA